MAPTLPAYLQREHSAFVEQLDNLRADHEDEFVLFKDGKASGFYPTYKEAYEAALDLFGLDAEFLIQEVVEDTPVSVSISWEAGVAFGQ